MTVYPREIEEYIEDTMSCCFFAVPCLSGLERAMSMDDPRDREYVEFHDKLVSYGLQKNLEPFVYEWTPLGRQELLKRHPDWEQEFRESYGDKYDWAMKVGWYELLDWVDSNFEENNQK